MAAQQAVGFVASLIELAGLGCSGSLHTLPAPGLDCSASPPPPPERPLDLLVDCTGITFRGDGESQTRKDSVSCRQQGDSAMLPSLLPQLVEAKRQPRSPKKIFSP